jgi:hypothetical protein
LSRLRGAPDLADFELDIGRDEDILPNRRAVASPSVLIFIGALGGHVGLTPYKTLTGRRPVQTRGGEDVKHIISAAVVAVAALAPLPALAQYNNPYSPYATAPYPPYGGQTPSQLPPYANPNFGGGYYTNQAPGQVPSYVAPNGLNGGYTGYSSPGQPPTYVNPRPRP